MKNKMSFNELKNARIQKLVVKECKQLKGGSGGGVTHDIIVWPM